MAEKGEKKTVADYPELVAQWHPTKNGELRPRDVTRGKVWWKCPEGPDHVWCTQVGERAKRGRGCPFCRGLRISVTNSLAINRPDIAAQWHLGKNGPLAPNGVTLGSRKRVWWKCPEGPDHEWEEYIQVRTKKNTGCPACSGRRVSVTNNLAALYPEVSSQWHPTKNGSLKPSDVASGTHKKVWWKCVNGPDHEWPAKVGDRTGIRGTGCPFCSNNRLSTTNSLLALHPELAAEWHPSKNGVFNADAIIAGTNKKFWWKCPEGPDHEWLASPNKRAAGRNCPFCAGKQVSTTNGLTFNFPEIAAQLHTEKNGDLKPESLVAGSQKKVWWKCPEGPDHEWKAALQSRTMRGSGCPCCSGNQLSVTNCLSSAFPEVADEWHPSRNGAVTPDAIIAGSHKKFWWKCPAGPDHEWRTSVKSRTAGRKCPACAGLQVSVTNNLAALFPEVAAQWHPTKNKTLSPDAITAGNPQRVWWKCPAGPDHEWRAAVGSRTGPRASGCPACAGQQVSVTNSLANCFPEISAQWDLAKNGTLKPSNLTFGSNKSVWWKCPNGPDHMWKATPRTRIRSGCPACAGQQVSLTNSLESLFPSIAAEFHPTKNGQIRPVEVIAGSGQLYIWRCAIDPSHEWETTPYHRTVSKTDCPYCNIAPRSKQEIRLAFELAHHIPIDHDFHKIKTARRLWDVDICAPDLKLVIEFDGSFWHAEKGEKDRAKAKNLRHNGWRVVRVREAPLKKLSKWNVVIPTNADAHEAALLVLEHLQIILNMDIPRMDERGAAEGPLCADAAEAYIEKLLLEKQAKEEQDG